MVVMGLSAARVSFRVTMLTVLLKGIFVWKYLPGDIKRSDVLLVGCSLLYPLVSANIVQILRLEHFVSILKKRES